MFTCRLTRASPESEQQRERANEMGVEGDDNDDESSAYSSAIADDVENINMQCGVIVPALPPFLSQED